MNKYDNLLDVFRTNVIGINEPRVYEAHKTLKQLVKIHKQLPSKEETDMMKHWCEVGILKEAHEFQINGSGFNSTITRMDNFFNTIYGDNK